MGAISTGGDVNVHGGAPFDKGLSTTVFLNNQGVALVGQTGSNENDDLYNRNHNAHPQGIAANQTASVGSATVFANNIAVHRIGDARIDGSTTFPPGLTADQITARNNNQCG